MKQPCTTGQISYWFIIPACIPFLAGLYMLTTIRWDELMQQHQEAARLSLTALISAAVFIGASIILSLFMKEIVVDTSEIMVKYPVQGKVMHYLIHDIEMLSPRKGAYKGISFELLDISFKNGTKLVLNSKEISNYENVVNRIKHEKRMLEKARFEISE